MGFVCVKIAYHSVLGGGIRIFEYESFLESRNFIGLVVDEGWTRYPQQRCTNIHFEVVVKHGRQSGVNQ